MRPTEDIKKLINKMEDKTSKQMDKKILNDVLQKLEQSNKIQTPIGRLIMKKPIIKYATVVIILITMGFSISIFSWLTAPTWAFGQTVKAIKNSNNIIIQGTINSDSESMPFTFWTRFPEVNHKSFDTRFECEKEIVVTNGYKAWVYEKDENKVNYFEDIRTSDGMMRDLGFWYKLSEEYPWISGTILSSIKHITDDWDETYAIDEQTGRESVFVTCRFEKLSVSLWFVCDIETKLITKGKFWNWRQTDTQVIPKYNATSFSYNEKIDDGLFDFQIPDGATVNGQNQADILFSKAEKLFHEEKKYSEALELYTYIYETYPDLNNGTYGANALMMIGICYGWLPGPA